MTASTPGYVRLLDLDHSGSELRAVESLVSTDAVSSSRETPEMVQRYMSAIGAQLTPAQAEAAANELRGQAESAEEPALKKLLGEVADSLSLPKSARSVPDVNRVSIEMTEALLWPASMTLAQLTPTQAEAIAGDLRQQAQSEKDLAMKQFLRDSAKSLVGFASDMRSDPPPQSG